MAREGLRLVVRTPQGVAFEASLRSLRVPADTGQVGLRPRTEPGAMAVEPGLALADEDGVLHFIATAGGLLRWDGAEAVLLTPVAVSGESAAAVRQELERALAASGVDLQLRTALQRLETGILTELRRSVASPGASAPHE